MDPRIQIVSILGSGLILAAVFGLIRQRKLREEYALLWLGSALLLIVVSLWRGLLEAAARLLGVAYPPSVLLLAAIVLGFLLAMHYSISLSRLDDQNKRLAQEVALLRFQVEALQPAAAPPGPTGHDRPAPTAEPPRASAPSPRPAPTTGPDSHVWRSA